MVLLTYEPHVKAEEDELPEVFDELAEGGRDDGLFLDVALVEGDLLAVSDEARVHKPVQEMITYTTPTTGNGSVGFLSKR